MHKVKEKRIVMVKFDHPNGQLPSIVQRLPGNLLDRIHFESDRMWGTLEDLRDTVLENPELHDYNVIKALCWDFCQHFPDEMGVFMRNLSAEFLAFYGSKYVILGVYNELKAEIFNSPIPAVHVKFQDPCNSLPLLLSGFTVPMRRALKLNGDMMHTDIYTLAEVVNHPSIKHEDVVKVFRRDLSHLYPEYVQIGDEEVPPELVNKHSWEYAFLETNLKGIDPPLSSGYHRMACVEPLILEPEDWAKEKWETLCELCGVVPKKTSRIVIDVKTIQVYVEKETT